jgi:ADP-ribosylglycohydrolase
MSLPHDYVERVYAGVLGKIIGVYLGRPFEGWTYERIMQELGEVWYYVHEKLGVPLIVTDDDISGTFTFLRALPDYGNSREITPAQIGQSWLNYLIERRTVLWWGGMGNSTEHTAYMRLKQGIEAPQSGSIALNGKTVAEQIGAQIFIDGWAMVAPGDPQFAADLARRASSVSHDGEAIYGAQVLAAMEAQAFVESGIDALLDTGVSFIPKTSIIYRLIDEIRGWHAQDPDDWRKTREKIAARYGYDKYGGNCHMVPNHALIIHALLHGDDDFQKSLMVVNTCGWDTDCNSGNLGCLLGIKNGLAGIDRGADFRGPVADRLYLATADGGRGISDAATEAIHIVNIGRALAGEEPIAPKGGARFHFELPGSVQGFQTDERIDAAGTATLENVAGQSRRGDRSLAIRYANIARGRIARVGTPTFIPSVEIAEHFERRGYALLASPTLYSGQTVRAEIQVDAQNETMIWANLYVSIFQDPDDHLEILRGEVVELAPGDHHAFTWQLPDTGGAPIAQVGVEIHSEQRANGVAYLDYLTWEGAPNVIFTRTAGDSAVGRFATTARMWRRAWVNGVDQYEIRWPEPFRLAQNEGRGLLIQGGREWTDYEVASTVILHMVKNGGIAARVQGMRRYYALLLGDDGKARLIKALDGDRTLAEIDHPWECGASKEFRLCATGDRIQAWIDGQPIFDMSDEDHPLDGGGVAFVVEEGRIMSEAMVVTS